jgi:hypothetical protein
VRVSINKVIGIRWGPLFPMDAFGLRLLLIPRFDLAEFGGFTPCALRIEVFQTALDACERRWRLRWIIHSDARWITETVAARAGA